MGNQCRLVTINQIVRPDLHSERSIIVKELKIEHKLFLNTKVLDYMNGNLDDITKNNQGTWSSMRFVADNTSFQDFLLAVKPTVLHFQPAAYIKAGEPF